MLREFESDGWLTLDGAYDVPAPVRPAVLDALKSVDLYNSFQVEVPASLLVTVRLLNTDPPVWRRLELDAELTLDVVHVVLQEAFEWEGTHLHQFLFRPAGLKQTIYGPAEWVDELGDHARMEDSVTIGSLLRRSGDTLTYEYDFGDGWEHTITLDSIGASDSEFFGARCVDGGNMTPFEDSGGPWGWNEHLAAAADPGHEHHAESREWLGLHKKETIDPTAFNLGLTNAGVEVLFETR